MATFSIESYVLQVLRLEGLEGEVANLEATLVELAGDLEASAGAQAAMQRQLTAAEGELARARRAAGSAAVGDCSSWSEAAFMFCSAMVQSSRLMPSQVSADCSAGMVTWCSAAAAGAQQQPQRQLRFRPEPEQLVASLASASCLPKGALLRPPCSPAVAAARTQPCWRRRS